MVSLLFDTLDSLFDGDWEDCFSMVIMFGYAAAIIGIAVKLAG